MICSSLSICVQSVVRVSRFVQRQMSNQICFISKAPSSRCLHISSGNSESKYSSISVSKINSCSAVVCFEAFHGSRLGSNISKPRSNWHSFTVKSIANSRHFQKTCLAMSLGSQNMILRLLMPRRVRIPKIECNLVPDSWLKGCASAGLIFSLLVCNLNTEPVHAEAPEAKEDKEDDCDSSSASFSHGKKVHTDYSVTGIPGDGRCLFRSVAHGACLRSGKPTPNENLQRELADELRARVAEEFVKRRKETEWFIEGDFDTYISQIRKPHVWGGEPELLMASHVLQMPITVYMHDKDSGGLISIAEYGQEYGKDNPIKILYHGFGHYDSLQIPGKKGIKSRL